MLNTSTGRENSIMSPQGAVTQLQQLPTHSQSRFQLYSHTLPNCSSQFFFLSIGCMPFILFFNLYILFCFFFIFGCIVSSLLHPGFL